jgi:hypothetical protein
LVYFISLPIAENNNFVVNPPKIRFAFAQIRVIPPKAEAGE